VLQRLRRRLRREEGFTLIELLVVILIIGILAAIAIPSFLNQKGKGEDASAKSNAKTAQTAWETYYTDNNSYDCSTVTGGCAAALDAIESTLPTDDLTLTPGTGAVAFTVVATGGDGRTYTLQRNTDGSVDRACDVPAGVSNRGGCPANGEW